MYPLFRDPITTGSVASGTIRTFETGATRDTDSGKHDYEGFLSPLVIERFGEYMSLHRHQADGKLRDSDNWQKGIPKKEYIKSMFRHLITLWGIHRGYEPVNELEVALCGILFNAQGYLHEVLKEGITLQNAPSYCDTDSVKGSEFGSTISRVFTKDVKVGGSDPDEIPH